MAEREQFTVRLPETVSSLMGQARDKGLVEIRKKLGTSQPRADASGKTAQQITMSLHDEGADTAIVEFWSHAEDPRHILEAAGLKPMDLIKVEVPEKYQKDPAVIKRLYKTFADRLMQVVKAQNGKAGQPTTVEIRSVAPNNKSVELRVRGNADLIRELIAKTQLKILS